MNLTLPRLRTAVFIDGANLHHACSALQKHCDYESLKSALYATVNVVHLNFYLPAPESGDAGDRTNKLLSFLAYNGYRVFPIASRKQPLKSGAPARINMAVEMSIPMIEAAAHGAEQIILYSGDSDFIPAVQYLQRRGVRVAAVSTVETASIPMSDLLRRTVDDFIDLNDEFAYMKDKRTGVEK